MKFSIDKGLALDTSKAPEAVKRMMGALDALPNGELVTRLGLAAITDRSVTYTFQHAPHPALDPYRYQQTNHFNRVLFGNRRTIALLRKHEAKRAAQAAA
jgi:hypothetical protein